MDELTQRTYDQMADAMRRTFITCASSFFNHVTVNRLQDLPDVQPPAIAYVKEYSCYFLKYFTDPAFENTPYYSKHGTGWHPLDVSSPRFDRPIHVINTRWVTVNGFTEDLDYPGKISELTEEDVIDMTNNYPPIPVTIAKMATQQDIGDTEINVKNFPTPVPLGSNINVKGKNYTVIGHYPVFEPPSVLIIDPPLQDVVISDFDIKTLPLTNLGMLPPEHLIFRVGREDMSNPFSILKPENNQWYVTSVECYAGHPEIRQRWCWNVMKLAVGNYAARFDRVIHTVENEIARTWDGNKPVTTILRDLKKIVPGDILFDRTLKPNTDIHRRRWDYVVPKNEDFIPLEFARELIVLSRAEFDSIKKYFQLTRIYVINLTHGSQNWQRMLPVDFDEMGNIIEEPWEKKQYPAEFCYWSDYE